MRQAGIKVWMLTGDKVETAVTIGHSSGLLDEHGMKHYYLTNPKEESLLHTMVSAQKEIKNVH
jgi:magnesium-transporting ATPase (P-type)